MLQSLSPPFVQLLRCISKETAVVGLNSSQSKSSFPVGLMYVLSAEHCPHVKRLVQAATAALCRRTSRPTPIKRGSLLPFHASTMQRRPIGLLQLSFQRRWRRPLSFVNDTTMVEDLHWCRTGKPKTRTANANGFRPRIVKIQRLPLHQRWCAECAIGFELLHIVLAVFCILRTTTGERGSSVTALLEKRRFDVVSSAGGKWREFLSQSGAMAVEEY